MNRNARLHGLWAAVIAELLSSYWMFISFPTDSNVDYYPTSWSYMGEHFLVWSLVASPLFAILVRNQSRMRSTRINLRALSAVAVISLAAEVASSAYLWYFATLEGNVPKLWYVNNFGKYLQARAAPWGLSFVIILTIEVFIKKDKDGKNISVEDDTKRPW